MSAPWAAGWPRERMRFKPFSRSPFPNAPEAMLPVLFVGGENQQKNDWLNFDDENLEACRDGACAVCGEPLNRIVVFGAVNRFESNGPPVHPRCFALTLKFCPHFQHPRWKDRRRAVAYVYEGDDYRDALVPAKSVDYVTFKPGKNGATDTSDPRFLLGSQFSLKRGTVTPYKREACIDLAKSDPLGLGTSHNEQEAA